MKAKTYIVKLNKILCNPLLSDLGKFKKIEDLETVRAWESKSAVFDELESYED